MSSSPNRRSSNPDSNEPRDLLIGEIVAPQGLKGEVRVYPHTDFPARFADLREVGVRRAGTLRVYPIVSARVQGNVVILKLGGVDTVDDAEALRGAQLLIPASWAVPLGQDEYYHHQLLGLEVVTTEGASLGPITEIWQTGANDVYETPLALIPAVKEFVLEVDLPSRRMIVADVPGLRKADPGT